MDCPQALENLSGHLDDALDPVTRADLEAHLRTCANCRSELETLRTCVEAVSSLKRISAPPGFLAGVHERIREGSRWNRLVRKLMVPWQIKLPLHAAGAAVVLMLVLLMIPAREPSKRSLQVPGPVTSAAPTQSPLPAPADKAARGGLEADRVTAAGVASESSAEGQGDAVIELVLLMKPDRQEAAARPPQSVQKAPRPEAGESPGLKSSSPAPRAGAMGSESYTPPPRRQEIPETRPKEEKSTRARLQDRGRAAHETPGQFADKSKFSRSPASDIEDVIRRAGGSVSSTEADPSTGAPRSILVLIPSANFRNLLSMLREKGRVEGASQDLFPQGSGTLHVRIKLESTER